MEGQQYAAFIRWYESQRSLKVKFKCFRAKFTEKSQIDFYRTWEFTIFNSRVKTKSTIIINKLLCIMSTIKNFINNLLCSSKKKHFSELDVLVASKNQDPRNKNLRNRKLRINKTKVHWKPFVLESNVYFNEY